MIQRLSFFLRLVLTLSLALSFPAFANEAGGGGGMVKDSEGGGAGLSNATTKAVINSLKRGMKECQILREIYRFDCYRKAYHRTANLLNGRPAYTGALAALVAVEDTLNQIVKRNKDPKAKKKRVAFAVYTPVKPAAVPKATADFEKALNKAETTLLRSPENTQVHYARIAEVVHSNKVLLRS